MRDKLVLFNVKYSPNLGDGIIALCLEHELHRHFRTWEIQSIDLAGRTSWPTSADDGGSKRAFLLPLLSRLPFWANEMAVRAVLGNELKKRLIKFYAEHARDSRFAVIGGGQLFQDADLNFPLKLSAAVDICNASNIPISVYGVGASASRSRAGLRIFRRVLSACPANLVFVRDAESAAHLKYSGASSPEIYLDPGLLASELWVASRSSASSRPTIGLCITHPAVLRHHGEVKASGRALLDRWAALIRRLSAEGYAVTCFTMGAGEDELYLAQLRNRLPYEEWSGEMVAISPRCATPAELVRVLTSFDLVIAHRLHACIVAYSYRIPAIGLQWDAKMEAFFSAVGQPETIDLDRATNDAFVARVAAALANPIPIHEHREALESARAGVRALAEITQTHSCSIDWAPPRRSDTG